MDHQDRIRQNLALLGLDHLRDISLEELCYRVDERFPFAVSRTRLIGLFIQWLYDRLAILDYSYQNATKDEIHSWCNFLRNCQIGDQAIADTFTTWEEDHIKMDPYSSRPLGRAWVEIRENLDLSDEDDYPQSAPQESNGSSHPCFLPSVKSNSFDPPSNKDPQSPVATATVDSHWGHMHPDRFKVSTSAVVQRDEWETDSSSARPKEKEEDLSFLTGANVLASQDAVMCASGRRYETSGSSRHRRRSYSGYSDYLCKRCEIPGHQMENCPTLLDPRFDTRPGLTYRCPWCLKFNEHFSNLCEKNPDPNSTYQRRVRSGIYGTGKPNPAYNRTDNRSPRESRRDERGRDRRGDGDRHARHRSRSPAFGERARGEREPRRRRDRLDHYRPHRSRSRSPREDRYRTRSSRGERERERVARSRSPPHIADSKHVSGNPNKPPKEDTHRDPPLSWNKWKNTYTEKRILKRSVSEDEGRLSFQDGYEGDDELPLTRRTDQDVLSPSGFTEEDFNHALEDLIAEVANAVLTQDGIDENPTAEPEEPRHDQAKEANCLDSMRIMSLADDQGRKGESGLVLKPNVDEKGLDRDAQLGPKTLKLLQGGQIAQVHKTQRIRAKSTWNVELEAGSATGTGQTTRPSEILDQDTVSKAGVEKESPVSPDNGDITMAEDVTTFSNVTDVMINAGVIQSAGATMSIATAMAVDSDDQDAREDGEIVEDNSFTEQGDSMMADADISQLDKIKQASDEKAEDTVMGDAATTGEGM